MKRSKRKLVVVLKDPLVEIMIEKGRAPQIWIGRGTPGLWFRAAAAKRLLLGLEAALATIERR